MRMPPAEAGRVTITNFLVKLVTLIISHCVLKLSQTIGKKAAKNKGESTVEQRLLARANAFWPTAVVGEADTLWGTTLRRLNPLLKARKKGRVRA